MGDTPKTKNTSGSSDTGLWGAVALLAIAALPALIVGFGAYWLLRNALTRIQFAAVTVAALVSFALAPSDHITSYSRWLIHLVFGPDRWEAPPWTSLVTSAALLCGITGLIMGPRLIDKLPSFLRRNKLGREEFLPTATQRRRIDKVVAPPTAGPATDPLPAVDPASNEFPIGINERGEPVMLNVSEFRTHGLILGATGSGKTETIKRIAGGIGDLGWDVMILDLKEDTQKGGLRDWVHDYADHNALPFQELRLSQNDPDYWFDVLHGLPRDEARDAIMSLTSFDDDYYQQICKKLMGQLLKLMYMAYELDPTQCPHPTLFEIARILSAPSLQNATKKQRSIVAGRHGREFADLEFDVLSNPPQEYQKQALSWGAKLGQVFETHAGATVLRPGGNRLQFDVTKPGMMYIGLDSQGKADLTRLVSSAVLQRLSAYSAQRTTGAVEGDARPKLIIVDEANWVDRTIVQNLLSRARGAKIAMFLATQGPKDWIDKDGDDFGRLAQNINVSVIMRQGDPESAELCAQFLGMQEFYDRTLSHRDGSVLETGSVRRETDFRVPPEKIRELLMGEALIRVGTPTARLTYTKVIMRDPRQDRRARAELNAGPQSAPAGPTITAPPI